MCTEVPNSGLRNSSTRWNAALGMSSALAAQASGSPPGSLTTCAAIRDGRIRASPSSSVKFSTSSANAAISRISIARLARAAGIRAEAFSGVSSRLCRISARSLGVGAKNMSLISAASFGCIDRFDCHAQLRFGRRPGRWRRGRRRGNFARERHRLVRLGAPQPELAHDRDRRRRIDRKPRPHRGARGVVDLVDQAGGQLDELPLLVGRMGAGLDIEVGQHAQQRRADIDALATGERHQPVETRKQWSCGHVRRTRLGRNPSSRAYAGLL